MSGNTADEIDVAEDPNGEPWIVVAGRLRAMARREIMAWGRVIAAIDQHDADPSRPFAVAPERIGPANLD